MIIYERKYMNIWSYFTIYKELIHADLLCLKQTIVDKLIDVTIWVVLTIVVTSYIMPYFGLSHDFGVFQLGGIIAAIGLFELYASAIELVADFEGNRAINYSLTLPFPSWMAIASKGTYYFIVYFVLSVFMLPIGKLTLWNQFDLKQIDYITLFLSMILQNIFYACFVLWIASIVANMSKFGTIWARCIFPMWFMGGFHFSWLALYHVLPIVAYINLLNPMMYITEATRIALLGQADYINFWICAAVMIFFSGVFFLFGLKNLKKRLDFI